MKMFSKNIKLLIFVFIISVLLSFVLSLFYPMRKTSFLFFKNPKMMVINSNDIESYNYKKINGNFVVNADKEFCLYKDNLNLFVKDIKINLKEPIYSGTTLKVFVHYTDSDKMVSVFETENKDILNLEIKIYKKIKNIVIVAGDKIGDRICLDNIILNDNINFLNDIKKYNYWAQLQDINFWIRFLLFFLVLFFIGLHFIFDIKILYAQLYKYRYFICLGIIFLAIAFELNNSSMDFYRRYIYKDFSNHHSDIIFGEARFIRADEFITYTTMSLSQKYNNYGYFSDILRGTKTDMFMVYGQPVKNIVTIFRPFLLGFLFLGSAKGLSFFWIVRLVLLFLITFEFLLLITKRNKLLSLAGTFLITFAPVVQWWWTPSGIVEIIIYGELLVLLLHNFFIQENFTKRIAVLFFITIISGSYLLVLYPAWQVPFAYIFTAIFLGVASENYKNYKFYKKDFLPITFFAVLFFVAFAYIYSRSKETIDIITHTVYPGSRLETGGYETMECKTLYSAVTNFFRYWGNMFLSVSSDKLQNHQCYFATFFDLFPIGIITAAFVLFKDKIKDKMLMMLLCLYSFFVLWCIVGFPKILSQITLMKVSSAYRTFVVMGYLDILILLRSLAVIKYKPSTNLAFFIGLVGSILVVLSNIAVYNEYFDITKIISVAIISFILFYLILRNKINKIFIFLIFFVMFFSGILVNPIQRGTGAIDNLEITKAINKINTQEKGLWLVEYLGTGFINLPISQGASTFNSINTYPNFEAFKKIDKEHKYENVYNRYASIIVTLFNNTENTDKFQLLYPDAFKINITVDELLELGINYIFTGRSLESFNNNKVTFEKLYKTDTGNCTFYIYKVVRN